jgi:hypothetical protein
MSKTIIIDTAGAPITFIPEKAVAVTPSDTTLLDAGVLFVGVGGDIVARPVGNADTVTFKNVPDGSFLPIRVVQVYTTLTTATNMLICY